MKKWWQVSNDHGGGILGVLHKVQNILTEAIRIVLKLLHLNFTIGGKDAAYVLSHLVTAGLFIYLAYVILDGQQVLEVIQ